MNDEAEVLSPQPKLKHQSITKKEQASKFA